MNNNLGYVAIDCSDESKQMLFNIVSQKIPEKDYFRSQDPGYTYINGNVCQKSHLTICYGIKNLDLEKRFKAAKLKLNLQKNIKIKDIQIHLGYQSKYYIIVAIPEVYQDIFSLDSWIRQNNDIVPDASSFDPHLSLCYVKNQDNTSPADLLKYFQEKLIGKTIRFESVNFYLPQDEEKITLIRL